MGRKGQLELTFRDVQIVEFVFEQRAVSFKQLAEKFFKTVGVPTAFKRLEKLYLAGLLTKKFTLWRKTRTTYYGSTDKGIKALAEHYRYKITRSDFKSDSVQHDIGLVRLRERLEKTKMLTEYLSESMLQNCSSLAESESLSAFSKINSDAALHLKKQNAVFLVALEYEVSDKSKARYTKKLTDYYFSRSIGAVLYVCGDGEIQNAIRRCDKDVGQKFPAKIFTCLEDDCQNSPDRLVFFNRENVTLVLE